MLLFSHPAVLGSWASSPPDNITLICVNKKIDQSLSGFQTDTGAAAQATLDTEQLISHTRAALIDTILSMGSDGAVSDASEVHELLNKIHDILDSTVSKWLIIH